MGEPAHATASNSTDPSTGGTLVVLDPDAPETTLRRVVPDVAVDGPLYLLLALPDAEYERRRRARAQAGVTPRRGVHDLADEARRLAERVGKRCPSPAADFEAIGAVGRRRERVLDAVEANDVERVYVPEASGTRALRERVRTLLGLPSALDRALPADVTVTAAGEVAGGSEDGGGRAGRSAPSDG